MKPDLDPAMLAEMFAYDKDTGIITRLKKMGTKPIGSIACIRHKCSIGTNQDRFLICVNEVYYRAARVAWIMHNNERIPDGKVIDHINGNKLDDRIVNLRCVSQQTNAENMRGVGTNSKSGLLGAMWEPRRNKWISAIRINGKQVYLGSFKTREEAHAAYIVAKRRFHKGCTI